MNWIIRPYLLYFCVHMSKREREWQIICMPHVEYPMPRCFDQFTRFGRQWRFWYMAQRRAILWGGLGIFIMVSAHLAPWMKSRFDVRVPQNSSWNPSNRETWRKRLRTVFRLKHTFSKETSDRRTKWVERIAKANTLDEHPGHQSFPRMFRENVPRTT